MLSFPAPLPGLRLHLLQVVFLTRIQSTQSAFLKYGEPVSPKQAKEHTNA